MFLTFPSFSKFNVSKFCGHGKLKVSTSDFPSPPGLGNVERKEFNVSKSCGHGKLKVSTSDFPSPQDLETSKGKSSTFPSPADMESCTSDFPSPQDLETSEKMDTYYYILHQIIANYQLSIVKLSVTFK